MVMTVTARRAILRRGLRVMQELYDLNERAAAMETELSAQGLSDADIETTLNKLLDAGGPPTISAAAIADADGGTLTDELFNLLNSNVTGGVDWAADAL